MAKTLRYVLLLCVPTIYKNSSLQAYMHFTFTGLHTVEFCFGILHNESVHVKLVEFENSRIVEFEI